MEMLLTARFSQDEMMKMAEDVLERQGRSIAGTSIEKIESIVPVTDGNTFSLEIKFKLKNRNAQANPQTTV